MIHFIPDTLVIFFRVGLSHNRVWNIQSCETFQNRKYSKQIDKINYFNIKDYPYLKHHSMLLESFVEP